MLDLCYLVTAALHVIRTYVCYYYCFVDLPPFSRFILASEADDVEPLEDGEAGVELQLLLEGPGLLVQGRVGGLGKTGGESIEKKLPFDTHSTTRVQRVYEYQRGAKSQRTCPTTKVRSTSEKSAECAIF